MILDEKLKKYYLNIVAGTANTVLDLVVKIVLCSFSFLYYCALLLYETGFFLRLFKTRQLDVPVISVGNITWGGTGKTPLVLYLLKEFDKQNKKTAVLTRGYGNDEHLLYKKYVGSVLTGIGSDRYRAGIRLLENHLIDIFILDDGFSHIKLKRNLDIVILDSKKPLGNNWLIPRGMLRAPVSSLQRADIILINRCSDQACFQKIKDDLKKAHVNKPEFFRSEMIIRSYASYKTGIIESSNFLKNQNACVFSGIANPSSFLEDVKNTGVNISQEFVFTDHYKYSKDCLDSIVKSCVGNSLGIIITTEKDIARIESLGYDQILKKSSLDVYYPVLDVVIHDYERFWNVVNKSLRGVL